MAKSKPKDNALAQNRKARHDYNILETYEAGIALTGTEIKSVRASRINLKDGFAQVKNGEVWLMNVHISLYDQGNIFNHDPLRNRKLLMNKREILKYEQKVIKDGYTIVPTKLYLKNGKAKLEIALGKGKKNFDKRETIKERDDKRNMAKALKRN